MATVDSGTDTLFSDDSPCDLGSPTACSGEEFDIPVQETRNDGSSRFAPPNIQPYSGVLERGKILIRPIAFKPALNSPGRFGVAGERYGSTPILTRPGSRLTLYGSSNDLHQINANINNYSLDRKLRSSCQSSVSSPPQAMSSLTSLPHNLMNYDSLESIRKSPTSTLDGSIMNKASYRLASEGGGSLLDLTPSPSDSGVSELEAALRDRDSELAYLRQTMEHNEQVIFRVYQEKERSWEREIRRLKVMQESSMRTNSQKAFKMEQMLMMQNYQFQLEKKRLCAEAQRTSCQNERLLKEVALLRSRLEESEWGVCQKTGEISLLKSQLKDFQHEQNAKGHEILQTRNECREVREILEERQSQITILQNCLHDKDDEIDELQKQLKQLQNENSIESENAKNYNETDRLRKEIQELREELSEVSMSEYEGLEAGRMPRKSEETTNEDLEIQRLNAISENATRQELVELKSELDNKKKEFERERYIWVQEKEKVLRYQRQLQMNYVQMYRRTRALESEVESLSVELEIDKPDMKKKLTHNELTQTIEL